MSDQAHPERFDPGTALGTLMHAEHTARYRWASMLTTGKDVLDAGCGTGYGTAILAESEPSRLVGVDIAEEATDAARATTGARAEIHTGDVRDLPFADDEFDVVVCFEVIEHIDRRDEAVREFARVLRPDGLLLISSPNRNEYPPGNEHHVYEYTPEELEAELAARFETVRLLRQQAWLASVVADREALGGADGPAGSPASLHAVTAEAARREGEYIVAIAGRSLPPEVAAHAVLGDTFEVKWWKDQVDDVRERLGRRLLASEREITRQSERLQELGSRLLEAEQVHAALIAERADLASRLEDSEAEAERFQMLYERADGVVKGLQDSFSWKLTSPLRRAKGLLRRR